MEQVYKGIPPPFLTNWPIRPGQVLRVPDPPRHILPKPACNPSGFAYDHDDLPKLVAVHSLTSSPHVINQLQLASVRPMQPAIVGAPPPPSTLHVTNIRNVNVTVTRTKTCTDDEKSTSPTTPIKKPEVSTPNEESMKKSANTTEDNKDLRKLLSTINNTILKVQELRTYFNDERKEQIKRRLLDQLLAEIEKLRVMKEVTQGFQIENNTTVYGKVNKIPPYVDSNRSSATSEAVAVNQDSVIENVQTSSSQMFEVLKSTESKETAKDVQTHNVKASHTKYLNDHEDHNANSDHLASDDDVSERLPSPVGCLTSPSEHLGSNDFESFDDEAENNMNVHLKQKGDVESDDGVADLEQDDEEEPILTKYVRCAGILEERHEGDNFICDEWTMNLDTDTHKAIFRRRPRKTSQPFEMEPDLDESEFYQPPEKKSSIESPDKLEISSQGELSSFDEESDVDIFRLETPKEGSQNVMTGDTDDRFSDKDDKEAEEAIMKLGRQLQLRDAKITVLNQKKEKLMEELRRIKIKSRDS